MFNVGLNKDIASLLESLLLVESNGIQLCVQDQLLDARMHS